MTLTRRKQLLAGGAGAALAAGGIYELVDQLTGGSPSRAAAGGLTPEQHLLDGVRMSWTTASRSSCRRSTTSSSPRTSTSASARTG